MRPAKTKRFLIHCRGRSEMTSGATIPSVPASVRSLAEGGAQRRADAEQIHAEPDVVVGGRPAGLAGAIHVEHRDLVTLEPEIDPELVLDERVRPQVPVRGDSRDQMRGQLRPDRALQEVRALLAVI